MGIETLVLCRMKNLITSFLAKVGEESHTSIDVDGRANANGAYQHESTAQGSKLLSLPAWVGFPSHLPEERTLVGTTRGVISVAAAPIYTTPASSRTVIKQQKSSLAYLYTGKATHQGLHHRHVWVRRRSLGVPERRDAAGAAGGGDPEGAGVHADERGGAVGGDAGAAAGLAGMGALLREPLHRAAPQARRRRRPHHHPARLRQPPLHPHVRRRRQEQGPLQGRRRLDI